MQSIQSNTTPNGVFLMVVELLVKNKQELGVLCEMNKDSGQVNLLGGRIEAILKDQYARAMYWSRIHGEWKAYPVRFHKISESESPDIVRKFMEKNVPARAKVIDFQPAGFIQPVQVILTKQHALPLYKNSMSIEYKGGAFSLNVNQGGKARDS